MATYVVGDIQGCFDQFQCLLEKVSFNPDRDVIWSVGDLINRGSNNLATLRWFHERRDNAVVVLVSHHARGASAAGDEATRSVSLGLAHRECHQNYLTYSFFVRLLKQPLGVDRDYLVQPRHYHAARETSAVLQGCWIRG